MSARRAARLGGVLLLVVGTAAVVGSGLGWPPPGLVIPRGLPPGGDATGRRIVVQGIPFVELEPGYVRMGSHRRCRRGTPAERVAGRLGLPAVRVSEHRGRDCPPRWTVVDRTFWISSRPVTNREIEVLLPDRERVPPASGPDGPALELAEKDGLVYARLYARWLAERSGRPVRLPTALELAYARAVGVLPATDAGTLHLAVSE